MANKLDDHDNLEVLDLKDSLGLDAVEQLAKLMKAHGLDEIDILQQRGKHLSTRIRLSKNSLPRTEGTGHSRPASTGTIQEAQDQQPAEEASGLNPADHPGVVLSPMIGTVYLQPQPGSPKFVEVGNEVEEGQTLLIIEAMKTMNHIHAPSPGIVRRILVEDASIVEFGTPLLIID